MSDCPWGQVNLVKVYFLFPGRVESMVLFYAFLDIYAARLMVNKL